MVSSYTTTLHCKGWKQWLCKCYVNETFPFYELSTWTSMVEHNQRPVLGEVPHECSLLARELTTFLRLFYTTNSSRLFANSHIGLPSVFGLFYSIMARLNKRILLHLYFLKSFFFILCFCFSILFSFILFNA